MGVLILSVSVSGNVTCTITGGVSATLTDGQSGNYTGSSAAYLSASGDFDHWRVDGTNSYLTSITVPADDIVHNVVLYGGSGGGGGDDPDPGDNDEYRLRVYRANESATAVTLIEAGSQSATGDNTGQYPKLWIDISSVTGDLTVWVSVSDGWEVSGFVITRSYNNSVVERSGTRSASYSSRYDQYYYTIDSNDYGDADDIQLRVVVEQGSPPAEGDGYVNIYSGGSWHKAVPYIYSGGSWHQAVPYIYSGGSWHQGG